MSDAATRDDALRAIAAATACGPSAAVIRDLKNGVILIEHNDRPPLTLVQESRFQSPGAWKFDVAPSGPTCVVPRLTGYLAYVRGGGELAVVRLGDRAAIVDAWDDLAGRFSSTDLVTLLARYFGRDDAGVNAHQVVWPRSRTSWPNYWRRIAASRKWRPRSSKRATTVTYRQTLTFFTYFLKQLSPGAEFRFGVCRWIATWGAHRPLSWQVSVLRTDLRGIRYSRERG